MSNVDLLNGALKVALSDETTSCLLDLAGLDFLDSTVIKALVRWSNDAQLSDREALAIVVGEDTPAARLADLLGLPGRLPIFKTGAAARTALLEGQRARAQRSLQWLTDAELDIARSDAQSDSDTVADTLTTSNRRNTAAATSPTTGQANRLRRLGAKRRPPAGSMRSLTARRAAIHRVTPPRHKQVSTLRTLEPPPGSSAAHAVAATHAAATPDHTAGRGQSYQSIFTAPHDQHRPATPPSSHGKLQWGFGVIPGCDRQRPWVCVALGLG